MPDTFETFITNERARIAKEREQLLAEKAMIDEKLVAFDRELGAIAAYENAKAGRTTTKRTSATGGRRTGQREAVLAVVKGSPNGITAADVLVTMAATTDADKTSVRNALSALKRNGALSTRGGNYFIV